jgi:predicted phage tail protein
MIIPTAAMVASFFNLMNKAIFSIGAIMWLLGVSLIIASNNPKNKREKDE